MTRLLHLVSAFVLSMAGSMQVAAEGAGPLVERFQAGTHYEVLRVPVAPIGDGKGIEVVEVFSYECPHCYALEPTIRAWLGRKPEDVDFQRVPAVFSQAYEAMARAYYALEAMGLLDTQHDAVFHIRHDQGLAPGDLDGLAKALESRGVDRVSFGKALDSFGVRSAVQQAQARARAYRIRSVPTLVVAGRYRIDGSMAGSNAAMLEVADFLVARERARRQSAASDG